MGLSVPPGLSNLAPPSGRYREKTRENEVPNPASRRVAAAGDLPAAGVYVAVFLLRRGREAVVGALGRRRFPAGWYFYVGSAQRRLPQRLRRHGRQRKVHHWHIDYLAAHARLLGALVVAGPKACECRLARELARRYAGPCPGFGASDCDCPTHLFHRSLP